MIKIYYYSEFEDSTKKIIEFLKIERIEGKLIQIQTMTKEELIHILSLSDGGFQSIIKRVQDDRIRKMINTDESSTKEMINFLLNNRQLIKSPIVVDERRLQIGYHPDEMRQFIPRIQRMIQLRVSKQSEREWTYGIS